MPRRWAQILGTSGARLYGLGVALLSTAITARYLGPEGRGVFAAAFGWVSLFSTFGYLSLAQVVIHRAAGRAPSAWLPQTLGTLLGIVGGVTLLGWGVVAVAYAATGGAAFTHLSVAVLAAAFALLPLMLWVENGNAILLSLDALRVVNIAQVAGGTLGIALLFVFVGGLAWGVPGAFAALFAQYALLVLAGLAFAIRRAKAVRFEGSTAVHLLRDGMKLHLNAVGAFMATQAGVLLVNHFREPAETAYFQLSLQLVNALQVLPTAVGLVVYTVVVREGPTPAWGEQRRLLLQAMAAVAAAAGAAYLLAPLAVRILAGDEFLPAVPLFRIMLLGAAGMTFSIVMASQWIARGFFVFVSVVSLVVGGASVLGNVLFIPRFGAAAAAWVAVFTYTVSLLVNGAMALWVEREWRRLPSAA